MIIIINLYSTNAGRRCLLIRWALGKNSMKIKPLKKIPQGFARDTHPEGAELDFRIEIALHDFHGGGNILFYCPFVIVILDSFPSIR